MGQLVRGAARRRETWPLFGLALLPLIAAAPARAQGLVSAAPVLPAGGTVTAGVATIATSGATLTVEQSSAKAILGWEAFSIGHGGTVRIENGGGATLNRVTGGSVSAIDGQLSASGSVYLLNPNGVVIGTSGVVDVGGSFVASALDMADDAFLAGGDLALAGSSAAAVVNLGKVGALGGDVALIARSVTNAGTIDAANGTVGLIAGTDVLLRDAALDDGRFVVRAGGAGTSSTNAGSIAAAAAELRAAGGNVYALAGDTAGVIRATGVSTHGGRIFLIAGDAGTTGVAGTLVARGAGGAAGQIETSAGTVTIGAATIDAGAGGRWLVDPTDLTIDQTAATTIAGSLNAGTSVTQSTSAAGSGGSGDITVAPGVALNWGTAAGLTLSAYRNVRLGNNARITSTGGGAITLYADNTGTGTGAVTFGQFGSEARVDTAGAVNIFYNPPPGGAAKYSNSYDYAATVGGGGTLTAYALVNTVADLQAISQSLANTYALGRDIDAGGYSFTSIGGGSAAFTGTFDGQGHSVSYLTIAESTGGFTQGVGLFGHLSGVVRNLNLVGGSISSVSALAYTGLAFGTIGSVVGVVENGGTISNVSSTADVSGAAADAVGGLVGSNAGTITNSYASGSVTGSAQSYYRFLCRVSCAPTTFYTSTNTVGGLAGTNSGTITNAYATGEVSGGATNAGGFVGLNAATISGAYATGRVSGGGNAAGFVGSNSGSVTDAYWDQTTTGQVLGYATNSGTITRLVGLAGGTGYSPYAQSSYTHFTFGVGGTWFMIDGRTRPFLRSEYSTTIATAHQLQLMTMNLGASYTLGGDIVADETASASGLWSSAGFVPVGSGASPFSGSLDGRAHVVSGLSINDSASGGGGVGLFGSIGVAGAVRNLGLTGGSVNSGNTNSVGALAGENRGVLDTVYATADVGRTSAAGSGYGDNIGGLVGYNAGNISNASFSGAVSNSSNASYVAIGGLIGQSGGGVIRNASATATIAGGGASDAGGLIGYAASTTVSSSFSGGAINDAFTVGGLIGATSGGTVTNAYSLSSLTGERDGVVGGLIGDSEGAISHVYAPGLITANGARYVGGLVAYGGNSPIANGYYDVGTTGQASGIGLRTGSAAVSITPIGGSTGTSPYAASTYAGFDFGSSGSWVILEGSTRPILRSEYSTTVASPHQLQLIALDPYVDYSLAGDIDLGVTANPSEIWNPATGFTPIGGPNMPFTGALRGGGHTIANLAISRAGSDDVGLFAGLGNTGTVTNLRLANVLVVGRTNVGGLAGFSTGTVSGVTVSGSVAGTDSAGGLVGYNLGSVAGNANGAVVTAANFAGGLVGYNAGTLSGSVSASVLATGAYAGGLAGYSDGNGRITGEVTGGAVTATDYAGGLAGFNGGVVTGTRGTTTVATTVRATRGAGGVVAFNTGTIVDAASNASVTAADLGGGLVGVNFGAVSGSTASGAVGGGTQLGGFAGANGGGGTLTDDHATGAVSGAGTLGGFAGYNDGTIARSYATGAVGGAGANFVGGLVGYNARTVTGSYATGQVTGGTWIGGLAGYSDSLARIDNSGASGPVTGVNFVGGLAGYNGGAIDSSNANSAVAGDRGVAGLVGYNSGTITGAYALGSVQTSDNGLAGGLVGVNYGAILRSSAAVAVSGGGNQLGGLVGANAGTIAQSYATGQVFAGYTQIGGLAGYNSGSIADSYATGNVTGRDEAGTGGLVGLVVEGGTVTHAYASGALDRGGGVAGTNNGTLDHSVYDAGTTRAARAVVVGSAAGTVAVGGTTGRNATAQGSYAGFDFLDAWTIREGQSRPFLQSNPQTPPPN